MSTIRVQSPIKHDKDLILKGYPEESWVYADYQLIADVFHGYFSPRFYNFVSTSVFSTSRRYTFFRDPDHNKFILKQTPLAVRLPRPLIMGSHHKMP